MVQNEKLRVDFSHRLALASSNAGLDEHGRGMAIARHLKVSSKAVSKWFNAESVPRQDKMNALAHFLGVDVFWLQHGRSIEGSNVTPASVGSRQIPLLNYVQAGAWTESREIRSEDNGFCYTLTDLDCSPFTFAVEIEGESMLPQFKPGDRIIIDPEVPPAPGDFVVARHNGFEETVFKKYRRTGTDKFGNDTFELVPLNDDFPTLKSLTDDLSVIGTMIEHRIRRRRG